MNNKDYDFRDWARARIRAAGLRATPARIASLKAIVAADTPLTHAEVYECLGGLNVDKATVFRNLTDMVAAKVLRRTELGDQFWRFELVEEAGGERADQSRFFCVDCGSISYAEKFGPTESASQPFGNVADVLFRGHCSACV
ncbi:MAG TPA: Fur family transcriptional regulator [Planctomycetaceae bacterium]|nr:Fur family transcriptional regulator [Planctomycetaceae bacterium]